MASSESRRPSRDSGITEHPYGKRQEFRLQGGPSKTAWRVALRRAAHQILDTPLVLDDPVAVQIVGAEAAAAIRQAPWKHQLPFSRASLADGLYAAGLDRAAPAFF